LMLIESRAIRAQGGNILGACIRARAHEKASADPDDAVP
jgi:hypothetical protein